MYVCINYSIGDSPKCSPQQVISKPTTLMTYEWAMDGVLVMEKKFIGKWEQVGFGQNPWKGKERVVNIT